MRCGQRSFAFTLLLTQRCLQVIGSIAASGPVHATLNFSALLDQWTISASQFPGCVETAQSAVQQVYSLLESSAGRLKLKVEFPIPLFLSSLSLSVCVCVRLCLC